MSIRRKIADSPRLNRAVESLFAAYVRFAYATSRWERSGFEDMDAELAKGEPVIFTLWHQRLIMAPYMFNSDLGKFCSLTTSARAGRLVGQFLPGSGLPRSRCPATSATSRFPERFCGALRMVTPLASLWMDHVARRELPQPFPLIWARSSGKRIFVLSYSARRVMRFPSWDRIMLPLPFTRGVLMCRAWDEPVPRKMDAQATEILRQKLETALDNVTDASDTAAGRTPRHIRQKTLVSQHVFGAHLDCL